MACTVEGITKTELAKKLNTSQSAFSQRLKNGKFTQEELEEIAKALNCEYFSGFRWDDGTMIE